MQEAIYLWNKHLYDIWWRVWSQNLARVNAKKRNNMYGGLKLWLSEKSPFAVCDDDAEKQSTPMKTA